ncbi:MAG: hypothetical protein U0235_18595 [Polyangiaceae bacterium]
MSGAIVLVVLIAGRDDPASTDAAIRAARTALPPETSIVLQRVDAPPSDDEAVQVEKRERAQAVAVITVTDPGGRRVRLHVHRAEDRRWIDRDIAFESVDQPAERGRTLGFAMASMMPESFQSAPPPPPPAPPPETPPPPPDRVERPTTPRRAPVAALDAAALGAIGIAGYAGGLGARGGAAWLLSPRVALRVDGTIRTAEVAPAQVSSLVVTAGPGISIDAVPAEPVGLGIRVSALAIFHAHSHLSDESEPVRRSRWLPGASAALEGSLALSEGAALLLSGGSEIAFGSTQIIVQGREIGVIPPVRLFSDLGIRVRF